MLGDKQTQQVSQGSTAIQAGGNITILTTPASEIEAICNLVFKANFPILREEARLIAEENVQEFVSQLEERIEKVARNIEAEKFRDPDVQACMNDAVQAAARRGSASNQEILCTLIVERVKTGNAEFKEIVLSEAVKIAPRLNAQQISALCTLLFGRYISRNNITSLSELRPMCSVALAATNNHQILTNSQLMHLSFLGVTTYINISPGDIYDHHNEYYPQLGFTSGAVFKDRVYKEAPEYAILLERYNENKLWCLTPTSVGLAIAVAAISQYASDIDFDLWIN